jgi:hypothetical protein
MFGLKPQNTPNTKQTWHALPLAPISVQGLQYKSQAKPTKFLRGFFKLISQAQASINYLAN